MNIGEAARITGVSAKMIRYYESIGLVPGAARTDAGYRVYGADEIHTLRFVRRARDLGFSVEQISGLLALWRDRSRASADVRAIAERHVAELEAKARKIEGMAATLRHLVSCCRGDDRPSCPILADLSDGEAAPASATTAKTSKKGVTPPPSCSPLWRAPTS